jgi:two-component system, NarL family, response regulator DevR
MIGSQHDPRSTQEGTRARHRAADTDSVSAPGRVRSPAPIHVFVVDDHELIRSGLRAFIDAEEGLEFAGEAHDVASALKEIPRSQQLVVVLDVKLPDGSGIELCRAISQEGPRIRCLILTFAATDQTMFDALAAGAYGVLAKDTALGDLAEAIRAVDAGRTLFEPRAIAGAAARLRRSDADAQPLKRLTPQELIILRLITDGMTDREIAARMFLSEKTVRNYVSALLGKLGARHRTEAAVIYARSGGSTA